MGAASEPARLESAPGSWRGGAEWPLLGQQTVAAVDGRARDGGTHQRSAAHCANARRRVPGPAAPRSRTVPGCAWRRPPAWVSSSGSAPPHGHVHPGPRPRPAYSVPEIPADSVKATSGDPEPQRPVGESGSVEWSERVRGSPGAGDAGPALGPRVRPAPRTLPHPVPPESGRPQPCSGFSALLWAWGCGTSGLCPE